MYMSIYKMLMESGVEPTDMSTMEYYISSYESAKQEIIRNKMKKLVSLKFELGTLGKFENTLKDTIKSLDGELREKMAEEHNNKYMFFTINPRPSVKLEDFLKVTAKAVTKTCFTDYLYVIEQRGTNSATAGKGFHAHILVKRNLKYKPCKCRDNMSNTFFKMCNVKAKHLFNVKYLNTEWANDKISYMQHGGKTEDGKDIKQDIDIWWREKNNLLPYYGNIEITLN